MDTSKSLSDLCVYSEGSEGPRQISRSIEANSRFIERNRAGNLTGFLGFAVEQS